MTSTRIAALNKAIEATGGIVKFCAEHGVTHQAVYAWKRRGSVPLDRAIEIERVSGVPAVDLIEPKMAEAARMLIARQA